MTDDEAPAKPTALVALGGKYSHMSAIIDAEDLERVSRHRWCRSTAPGSRTNYAKTGVNGKSLYLHRLVMNAAPGTEINHVDGNGLNNTKANLEFVTRSQNMRRSYTQKAYDQWKIIEAAQTALQTDEGAGNDQSR